MISIDDVIHTFYHHFQKREWDKVSDMLHNDFVYFTDKCTRQNKNQFLTFLANDTWVGSSTTISEIESTVADSGELAVARYSVVFTGTFNTEVITINSIETMIFQRNASTWVILHCHTSNKV